MVARGRRLRLLALVAVAAVAVGIGLISTGTGLFGDIERASIDARFEVRGTREPAQKIAVVEVDDRTFSDLDRQWPLPRSMHGRLIRRLTEDGARAIAYDVQFTEATEPREDNALIEAVADAPAIVLATTEVDAEGGTNVFGGDEVLREIGARAGNAVVDSDEDGVLRRMRDEIDELVSFPVAVAELVSDQPIDRSGFDDDGEAWIAYAGPPDTFPTYSFSQVMRGQVPASAFKDAIVVVGVGAPSLGDVHSTPTSGRERMIGAEVVANAIATALDGFPLRSAPGWIGVLLVIGLGLVAPAVALRLGILKVIAIAVVVGAAFVVAAQLAFDNGTILPVVSPLVALILGTLGAVGVVGFFAAIDRERTRAQFARFVPERVVDDVLARADGARLGGVRAEATVLFCDLRGSTALLEKLSPERGIEVVNRYLTEMTNAVIAHGGTLAGFRGDGLIALFGAPLEQPDHAARALAAAREMAGPALSRVNVALREEGFDAEVRIGVGVASGEVMAGNVGSELRMEYTAIGDPANVAARLESMTKGSDHTVFVADATRALLGEADREGLELVGDLDVRGRDEKVTVWTLAPVPAQRSLEAGV
jgi:adenylate cyclase